jgi:glycosyltransferase involved in cell wall biosynthesis
MKGKPRVCLVQDAIPFLGGAERVLHAMLEIFPEAPVYTLFQDPEALKGTILSEKCIHTSFINRLPFARRKYRNYLPLFPFAIEQFDLEAYDLIISSSYAAAHGVLVRPDQLHVSYIHTPIRQAWHQTHQFLREAGLQSGLRGAAVKVFLHYMRMWDLAASSRVDHYLAPSRWAAQSVWRAYRRRAEVVYPPVETERFKPLSPRGDYYIVISRLAPHKRVDVIVEAFSRLGHPLVVIGDGRDARKIQKLARQNVKLIGRQPDATVQELLGKAKAFVHTAEEDFGIAAVEAQAAGCPVIAYRKGGLSETVIEGKTGLFFDEQKPESLMTAVQRFENGGLSFKLADLEENARRFNRERFKEEFSAFIEVTWENFKAGKFPKAIGMDAGEC